MYELLLVLFKLSLVGVQRFVYVIFEPFNNHLLVIIMLDLSAIAHGHVLFMELGVAWGSGHLEHTIVNIAAWNRN